jgi:hypothetical protein
MKIEYLNMNFLQDFKKLIFHQLATSSRVDELFDVESNLEETSKPFPLNLFRG